MIRYLLKEKGLLVSCREVIASPTSRNMILYCTLVRIVCPALYACFPLVVPQPHKAFDTVYMCFAVADEPLLLPSLERFKRLDIINIAWRPEREGNERESRRLIRESSVFQICWSIFAKVRSCIHLPVGTHSYTHTCTHFLAPDRRRCRYRVAETDTCLCGTQHLCHQDQHRN